MTGTTTTMTEALLYCRGSSDHQRDGVSLDGQLREPRQYAARMGFMLGKEYVDIASGKRDDRPQYQAMLADVRRLTGERKRVAVVVWRLDRLGRRLLERVQRRQELKQLGVGTHSVMENGEVSDVLANVMAALAEEEVRTRGERSEGSASPDS
jgi:DNA invertase Pin-like site-specific DNA recombinase